MTQSLAHEQPLGCSWSRWWISFRLHVCAPARAYSSSCSVVVPAGTLRSSLRSSGKAFASVLRLVLVLEKHSYFSPGYHFKSGKGAAACQDRALAVASNCSCSQAPGVAAGLLSPAQGADPPRRASCPSASQPAVQPHSPTCYSLPFEKPRNQSF